MNKFANVLLVTGVILALFLGAVLMRSRSPSRVQVAEVQTPFLTHVLKIEIERDATYLIVQDGKIVATNIPPFPMPGRLVPVPEVPYVVPPVPYPEPLK